jgi:hypothetical protein
MKSYRWDPKKRSYIVSEVEDPPQDWHFILEYFMIMILVSLITALFVGVHEGVDVMKNNIILEEEEKEVKEWAIVELMGKVRVAGLISEEQRFGVTFCRIDIPNGGGDFVTQYCSGSSIYRITPTTEEIARSVARANFVQPAHRWELPQYRHDVESLPDCDTWEEEMEC